MPLGALALTAAAIGLLHTLAGPDHYLPFASLAAARGWSTRRTLLVTVACGLAHVASSIALGFAAIALGWSATRLFGIDGVRSNVTAWLLLGVGLAYLVYGLKRAARPAPHRHEHVHADGTRHSHHHEHAHAHLHAHGSPVGRVAVASLVVVFLFGPCEPLIPLVLAPAAQGDWLALAAVCGAFTLTTVAAMIAAVLLVRRGADRVAGGPLGSYAHAAAGATIAACGVAIMAGL